MTVTAVGEITVLQAMPPLGVPLVKLTADLDAEVAALANFTVTPPSIQPALAVAAELPAGLTVAALLGVTPPSIDAQISITLALLAELELELVALQNLMGLLEASAHVYAYEVSEGAATTEIDTELASGLPGGTAGDAAFAITFIATAPEAVLLLKSLFKTTP